MKIIYSDELVDRICKEPIPDKALFLSQFDKVTGTYSIFVDGEDSNSLAMVFSRLFEMYLRNKKDALKDLADSDLLGGLHIAIFEFCKLFDLGKYIRQSTVSEEALKKEMEPRLVKVEVQAIADVVAFFNSKIISFWFFKLTGLLRQIAAENGLKYEEPNEYQLLGLESRE